ncbi:IclR family transcriptional regulator [Achromobacter sp. F4_2707]|uniref:IclR family transcriptional regulator n=1 Tax=Achromobacter sp. F4_2707 TaxID=3114286 RepID=UPI0039C697C5
MNKQAANVLELLEFFAAHQRPATLADIARHFDWPRSSTFKLLGTLKNRGYLYEPQPKGGYYPTPLLATLAGKIESAQPLPEHTQTLLEKLAAATQETVVLAAANDTFATFVATIESPHAVRYAAAVGKRVPLHATATGRALLSQMDDKTRASILRKTTFEVYSPTTLTSAAAVEKEIQVSRERGWFIGDGGYTPELGGVAMPFPLEGRCFALLIAGPIQRIQPRMAELVELLQQHIEAYRREFDTPAQKAGA